MPGEKGNTPKVKAVLLHSGGLDSTVLLYWLIEQHYDVSCLGFDYGQRHLRELNAAFMIAAKCNVPFHTLPLPLPWSGSLVGHFRDQPEEGSMVGAATVVPGRNLIFLSVGLTYALRIGANVLAIGASKTDHETYHDCRESFLKEFEAVARTYNPKFHLFRPFVKMTKKDIVEMGKRLRVPFEKTWSCYRGATEPCGECGACIERSKALGTHLNQGMSFAKLRKANG